MSTEDQSICRWVRLTAWLGAALGDSNIGDPVALSAREARFNVFSLKVGRRSTKPRLIDILEHIDVDNRVELVPDFTRDERHAATARANVERGRACSEHIPRHERRIASRDSQCRFWIGSPDTAVLNTEGATACPSRNFRLRPFPLKCESDIVAMGSWCRPGSRRRTNGATTSPYRPRTCFGSASRGR